MVHRVFNKGDACMYVVHKNHINDLPKTNSKMADNIDELKSIIDQISIDNDRMKNILDIKQDD